MLEEVFSKQQIAEAVTMLAKQVSLKAYHPCFWVVFNGAFMFATDFLRQVRGAGAIRFLTVDRGYFFAGKPHEPKVYHTTEPPAFEDRYTHVFLDVITEEGLTFKALKDLLPKGRGAKTVALVVKEGKNVPDFWGLIAPPDAFLTGYGMGPYRWLDHIANIRRK